MHQIWGGMSDGSWDGCHPATLAYTKHRDITNILQFIQTKYKQLNNAAVRMGYITQNVIAVWHNGNMWVTNNIVKLCQTGLVCTQVCKPATQVNSAWPSLCGTTSMMLHLTFQLKR